MATTLTEKEAKIAAEAGELMKKGDAISIKIKEACKAQDANLVTQITISELYPVIDPISLKIADLISLQLEVAKQEKDLAEDVYQKSSIIIIVTIVLALIVLISLSLMIINDISNKLKAFSDGLVSFFSFLNRETNTAKQIQINSNDEFGAMAKIVNQNILVTIGRDEDRKLIDETIAILGEFEKGDLCQRLNHNVSNPALMRLS